MYGCMEIFQELMSRPEIDYKCKTIWSQIKFYSILFVYIMKFWFLCFMELKSNFSNETAFTSAIIYGEADIVEEFLKKQDILLDPETILKKK